MGKNSYTFNNDPPPSDRKGKTVDNDFSNGAYTCEKNTERNYNSVGKKKYPNVKPIEMGDIEYKEKTKESTKLPDKPPNVGLCQLFRFADAIDKFLIIVGSLAAIINGLCFPANFLMYGEVVTGFIYFDIISDNLTVAYNMTLSFNVDDYTDVYGNTKGYALYFCLIGTVSLVSSTIQYACWDISMERQMLKLRSFLFKSIVHQDMGWFDQHNTGELGTSFTESMTHIELGIGREIGTFIQWIATFLGSYILALVTGWKLTLACLTFAPVIISIGGLLVKWIKNLSITEGRAYAQAGSVVTEVLTAIKTVMSFNGQEKESERYNRFLNAAKSMGVKKGLAMGLGLGFIWFFLFGLLATAFGYGVKLMNDGELGLEPGNVLLIFFSVMVGSISLAHAAPVLESIGNGRAAAAKVFAIIDTKPVIDSSSGFGLKPEGIHGSVELRNVSFTYPSRPEVEVLKDVNINMMPGQTVAIIGHSGCGKSTVVQLIERFYEVTAGQILLDGVDIRELNVEWLRNQIGLVSQEPVLFATSIRENIQFGRMNVTEKELREAARNANIHEFIELLPEGYDTMVGQRGTHLSGGQKQRIAIARALVRNPKILLLDEATSALDNESEAVVQKALENAQKGRTTIVIAHRLSTIQNADQIVAMDNGKVMECGTHADLMTRNGLYADLVRNQAQHSSKDDVIEELEHDFTGDQGSEDLDHSQHKFSSSKHKGKNATGCDVDKNEDTEVDENGKKADVPLKRLMQLNSSEWHYILGGCLCSAINGAMQPSLAFLISEYLKVFTKPEDEQLNFSLIMTGVILGIGLVNNTIRVFQNIFFALSGELLTTRLRRLTFKSFLKQDMEFFDDPKHQVSILASRLSSDATQVHGATGGKLGYLMESLAVVICSLVIAFISSWRLSLVVVALLPLMITSGILHGKILLGFAKTNKTLLEKAGHICSETIDNAKLVASLSREDTFKDKYISIISIVSRKSLKRCVWTSLLLGFSNSVLFFGYGAALTYGSYLMQEDLIAYYLVVRVFSAIIFGGQHIGRMSITSGDLKKAKLATSRLFYFIDRVPKIDSGKEDGVKQVQLQGNISFDNVDFNFPFRTDVQVLNRLSLEAKAGETIALVGASGCGKSTTVSLIERFYDPVDGTVMIDGRDTKSFNLRWLRSQIGFVQQEPVLFDCSIAENIAYGANDREVEMQEIIAAARSANIHSFIDALPDGYNTNVGNKGTQLSGGQKQRIAIARAMISNPRILLLDEATSALDSKSEQIVQEALDVAQKGRTCIVIAHRLSTVQNADKIAIIHKGSVVEIGSHSELMAAKGIYFKFLNLHNSKGKTK